jgi:hypothetical protein
VAKKLIEETNGPWSEIPEDLILRIALMSMRIPTFTPTSTHDEEQQQEQEQQEQETVRASLAAGGTVATYRNSKDTFRTLDDPTIDWAFIMKLVGVCKAWRQTLTGPLAHAMLWNVILDPPTDIVLSRAVKWAGPGGPSVVRLRTNEQLRRVNTDSATSMFFAKFCSPGGTKLKCLLGLSGLQELTVDGPLMSMEDLQDPRHRTAAFFDYIRGWTGVEKFKSMEVRSVSRLLIY